MAHDFNKYPELTNSQMQLYYFQSPHKQITSDFRASVTKVTDGDTIRVFTTSLRDFSFPVRFLDTAAPEMNEPGGKESKSWLEDQILNEEVEILIDPNHRVEKWGRLLGRVFFRGMDIGEMSILAGKAVHWDQRKEGKIPDFEKEMKKYAF